MNEEGLHPQILSIRLSQESECWEDMTEKVIEYLKAERQNKVDKKSKGIAQQEHEERVRLEEERELVRQKTGKDIVEAPKDEKKKEVLHFGKQSNLSRVQNSKHTVQVFFADEMELIVCAFKMRLQQIRTAIKDVDILLGKSKFEPKKPMLDKYRIGLLADLDAVGNRLYDVIEHECVEITGAPKPLIFFTKLQADIKRYLAEHSHGHKASEYRKQAEDLYKGAEQLMKWQTEQRVAKNEPLVIDSLKLSLTLNYAIFLYEIANQKKKGLRKIKTLIQEALDDFDKWEKDEIDQIKQQIELIQENINLWKQEVDTDSEEEN